MNAYPFAKLVVREYPTVNDIRNPYIYSSDVRVVINVSEYPYPKEIVVECILNSTPSLQSHSKLSSLQSEINSLKSVFRNVSSEIEISNVGQIHSSKIFREYSEAIKLSKMILKRFDYSIRVASKEQFSTPPFWIDMSRLYEVYVYSKLVEVYGSENIGFQVSGHGKSAVDFIKLDEHLIMDTKYKPRYENGNQRMMEDIREISGYARDSKVLKRLREPKNSNEEVKCVIIYPVVQPDVFIEEPNQKQEDNGTDVSSFPKAKLLPSCTEIKAFRNFYKISVPLPRTR